MLYAVHFGMKRPSPATRSRYVHPVFEPFDFISLEDEELANAGASEAERRAYVHAKEALREISPSYISDRRVIAALSEYPLSVAGHRISCSFFQHLHVLLGSDLDTHVGLFRESLYFLRGHFYSELSRTAANRSSSIRIRGIVRFIMSFAQCTVIADRPEVAIYALEEALRIDHEDHFFAREKLLLCYLKLVGRKRTFSLLPIDRGMDDVTRLLDCHFSESLFPLFDRNPSTKSWYNQDLMVLRWADIILKFSDGDAARSLEVVPETAPNRRGLFIRVPRGIG
jgi:hypothetical protein